MNHTDFSRRQLREVKVIPHSSKNKLIQKEGKTILYLQAPPEKDKANKALIKFFKEEFNQRVRIVSGLKRREKVIEVIRSPLDKSG